MWEAWDCQLTIQALSLYGNSKMRWGSCCCYNLVTYIKWEWRLGSSCCGFSLCMIINPNHLICLSLRGCGKMASSQKSKIKYPFFYSSHALPTLNVGVESRELLKMKLGKQNGLNKDSWSQRFFLYRQSQTNCCLPLFRIFSAPSAILDGLLVWPTQDTPHTGLDQQSQTWQMFAKKEMVP